MFSPTQQLQPIVILRDVGTRAWQGGDWGRSEAQVDALTFSHDTCVMQELGILGRGASLSDASLYLTPVDQVNLGVAFGMEDPHSALSGLGSSFSICDTNSPSPSIAPAQDGNGWASSSPGNCFGLVLTDDPAINRVPQTSDEVPGYSISSIAPPPKSYTINPIPQTSYLGQDTEESFGTAGSYAFPSADTLPRYVGSGQSEARSWAENPPPNLADPAEWIDSPSYLEENIEVVDFEAVQSLSYTANLPFGQQCIPFEGPISLCKWQDENGAICEDKITRASLPQHLSMHGIENMSRNFPTKCNWVGCKKKKPINRESIVRHIREVHLRFKRPPKQFKEPHLYRH